jgi:MFS family permease
MLFQFSLYGFLKNQRYFEPFLQLFLLAFFKGSFFKWGLLIGYRQVLVNVFEVPSGAVADLYGRRRCMMISFAAYIASFVVFGLAQAGAAWQLFVGMTLFAIGDAFRTGTHKAMIFDYLRHEGRADDKTRYYGTTRSWSKMGSALSVVVAAGLVFLISGVMKGTGASINELSVYRFLFLACLPPYVIQLANFALYPKYLDGTDGQEASIGKLFTHLFRVGRDSIRVPAMRALLIESMGFEGIYAVAKDYLQPIIKTAAATLPLVWAMKLEMHSVAALILVVYVAQYLLESFSSRRSDWVRRALGGEEQGARFLWKINLTVFVLIAAGMIVAWGVGGGKGSIGLVVTILGFMALAALQNFWRPLHIGRFDTAGDAKAGATILSLESQAKNSAGIVLPPLLGWTVDALGATTWLGRGEGKFLPVALVGVLFAAGVLIFRPPRPVEAGAGQPVPLDAE